MPLQAVGLYIIPARMKSKSNRTLISGYQNRNENTSTCLSQSLGVACLKRFRQTNSSYGAFPAFGFCSAISCPASTNIPNRRVHALAGEGGKRSRRESYGTDPLRRNKEPLLTTSISSHHVEGDRISRLLMGVSSFVIIYRSGSPMQHTSHAVTAIHERTQTSWQR